ncbi:MAG: N-acetylmuramoyl-L-alanine amidase [Phycisphaerae bacterium]
MIHPIQLALTLAVTLALTGCLDTRPGTWLPRRGDEIMICGQLFHTGNPVALWVDPRSYDAYRVEKRFEPLATQPTSTQPIARKPGGSAADNAEPRYGTFRRHIPAEVMQEVREQGWQYEKLREHVDQFVLHYDVCGTSRQCFKVLHDLRGLSVQFMIDVDGTIYQTLDVKERAWHASQANDRAVGVEIANIGAYSDKELEKKNVLDEWYDLDARGRPFVVFPSWMRQTGIRTTNFVARPARTAPIVGTIHGRELRQYDYTPEQYRALIKLSATLCRALPRIKPDFPRDAAGALRMDVLSDEDWKNFSGILGHYHLTTGKIDPGPALNWDELKRGIDRELARLW